MLTIISENESKAYLTGNPSEIKDVAEFFKFQPEGFYFMPAYKMGRWDGYIEPINPFTGEFSKGLTNMVVKAAQAFGFEIELDDSYEKLKEPIPLTDITNICGGGDFIEPYDYQVKAAEYILANKRNIIISPTGSGKSLIQYMVIKSLLEHGMNKLLLIVPTTSLVEQMYSDFEEYSERDDSFDVTKLCHRIKAGAAKDDASKKVYISTWQSLHRVKDKSYFEQFESVFVDECHKGKSDSIIAIMEKSINAKIKTGFTGTLEESKLHKTTLLGLFGDIYTTATIDDLIQRGILSELIVKTIILKHQANVPKLEYKDELDYIVTHPKRNELIMNLANMQEGNTLILFQLVKKHGKPLYEEMKARYPDRDIYFIYGGVKTEVREEVRKALETKDNAIIIANYQTFQEGINIKKLHNVIFASPSKSKVRVFQSLGRGLRTHGTKSIATLYDIADDLRGDRKALNHTLGHFKERLDMYIKEGFNIKYNEIKL